MSGKFNPPVDRQQIVNIIQIMRHIPFRVRCGFLVPAMFVLCMFASDSHAGALDDMLQAVEVGDVATARDLLYRGMDINTSDPAGNTLLILAARSGNVQLVELFANNRARIMARNRAGDTAVMLAAIKGHLPVVKYLVSAGADINHPGWTPLSYAALEGHTEVVRFLLDSGANANGKVPNGATSLMLAARGGHEAVVRLLLARRADVNAANEDGATAMSWALRAGNTDIADLLKAAGSKAR